MSIPLLTYFCEYRKDMSERAILWSDWLYLYRHRRELTCLDNILHLTHGKPLSLSHLLIAIHPADHRFTGVFQSEGDQERCIAQIYQSSKMSSAQINYLLAPTRGDSHCLVPLLEALVKKAGGWGAKQVVAEVFTDSPLLPHFRQAGFSVLAQQNVYQCTPPGQTRHQRSSGWRIWSSTDLAGMRNLYYTLVPPLVQSVEFLSRQEMLGLVYYTPKGDLQAYADLVYGPVGVWVLPVINPQASTEMTELLEQLLLALPDLHGRPVFITSRSYQPWLEPALCERAVRVLPAQALLVRYMAHRQRVKTEFSYPAFENGNREPTLPIAPIESSRE